MQDVIVADNEYITMKYLPDKGYIYHIVHKPIDFELFKVALDAGTETLKKYGVTKWLSDDRKNGPLSEEQSQWARESWTPRTIQAGWKYWALIVPTEVVSAGSMIPMIDAFFEVGVRMMVFDNADDAVEWLDGME